MLLKGGFPQLSLLSLDIVSSVRRVEGQRHQVSEDTSQYEVIEEETSSIELLFHNLRHAQELGKKIHFHVNMY